MKPEKCSFCKGDLKECMHDFISRLGDKIIAISGIPAWICVQCGEAYYGEEVSRKIYDIRKKVMDGSLHPLAAGHIKLSEIET